MPYHYDKPKDVCPASGGKHTWTFVRNGMRKKVSGGPLGSSMSISIVGVYRCACSKQRYGRVRVDQPGADLRDYEKKDQTQ